MAEGGIAVEDRKIYEDIALRTEGDIYIGVVGPVRTGKSTFIKRFMETLVIPNIENVYRRERARDELPQSGSGRTIMTAEPKFVPEEAVAVQVDGGAAFQMRMIDCVGYMVDGAVGQLEGENQRMVTTPWFEHEIPMTEAAVLSCVYHQRLHRNAIEIMRIPKRKCLFCGKLAENCHGKRSESSVGSDNGVKRSCDRGKRKGQFLAEIGNITAA